MQKNSDTNQIKFYVHGMHCESCQVFLKTKLSKHKDISKLETNLTDTSLLINKISEINDLEKFRNELNLLIKGSEYSVEFTPEAVTNNSNKYKETLVGFLVAGLFIFGFLSLQKAGLVNTLNSESVTLPFVFLVGLIASVSSCMAVVGGLILSLSTFMAKESPKYKKDVAAFHVSRVVSFFILGGVTGSIGKVFVITPQINLFINVFLLILGIS
jgi:cation transport ATPase